EPSETVAAAPLDLDASAPTLQLANAHGTEDNQVALDVRAALGDADGSESLSVTISGVPAGSSLSAGNATGDGSWTLSAGDLAGLAFVPPADGSGRYTLSVEARATESASGDAATSTGTLYVDIDSVADQPTGISIAVQSASGNDSVFVNGETGSVTLGVQFNDNDGSQTHSATVTVPDKLIVTDAAGGIWTPGTDGTGGTIDFSAVVGSDGRLDATFQVRAADTIPAAAIGGFAFTANSAEAGGATTSASQTAAASVSTGALAVDGTVG
ncbi:MAG: hypothetical protein ACK5U4_20055, partial [Rhodospirillales bacterium]